MLSELQACLQRFHGLFKQQMKDSVALQTTNGFVMLCMKKWDNRKSTLCRVITVI